MTIFDVFKDIFSKGNNKLCQTCVGRIQCSHKFTISPEEHCGAYHNKDKPIEIIYDMEDADKEIVLEIANSDNIDKSKRQTLINIHRKYLPELCRKTPIMRWLAEIDNPSPDYNLRAIYLKELKDSR